MYQHAYLFGALFCAFRDRERRVTHHTVARGLRDALAD